MTQQSLNFPDYPAEKRFPHFDREFIRLISKIALVNTVGAVGRIILEEVVMVEDTHEYQGAALFWIGDLAARVGLHRNNVSKHLETCVRSGWLHWQKTRDREIGIAWVIVPTMYETQIRRSRNRGAGPVVPQIVSENLVQQNSARNVAQNSARNVAQNSARNSAPSYPSPRPIPPPYEGEWAAVENELREENVELVRKALVASKRHGLRPADVQDLIQHFRGCKARYQRPAGALYHALRFARPEHRGEWWRAFPDATAFAERLAMDARARREAKERAERRQAEAQVRERAKVEEQLLFDWEAEYGPALNAMSKTEVLALCPDAFLRERCRRADDWRPGSDLRLLLLHVLHERAKANHAT